MGDVDTEKVFSFTLLTIFHYFDDYWFAWDRDVNVIRNPIARIRINAVSERALINGGLSHHPRVL